LTALLGLTAIEGQLPYASNTTLLARDPDDRLWVYKPEQGENPLWDFPWRSLAAREVLSFEVSEAMGLGIIPETRLAEGPYGRGSAQAFLDEDADFDPRPLFQPALDPCLWPFAVFDMVVNNADRKIGHMVREVGTGKLWGIDNGLTLHRDDKLRTVLWGFAGERLPPGLVEAVARLQRQEEVFARVAELLSKREAAALMSRVGAILAEPTHPQPPSDRPPIPWPLW
jgi:hypothetical protein